MEEPIRFVGLENRRKREPVLVKPYSGPEAWVYVTSGTLLVVAIALLAASFILEKRERSAAAPEDEKKWWRLKFLSFAGFFLALAAGAVVFFAGPSISYQHYRPEMVKYVESFDVKVADDGISVTEPLAPNSTVKFMVESKNGLVRCHAVSKNASDDVVFTCYDNSTKDFTIPLKDINKEPTEPAADSKAKPTVSPSAAATESAPSK